MGQDISNTLGKVDVKKGLENIRDAIVYRTPMLEIYAGICANSFLVTAKMQHDSWMPARLLGMIGLSGIAAYSCSSDKETIKERLPVGSFVNLSDYETPFWKYRHQGDEPTSADKHVAAGVVASTLFATIGTIMHQL